MKPNQTTLSVYWKCQLLFWSLAALQWAYIGYLGTGFSWELAILHFVLDLLIYIPLSHLYRNWSIRMGWHLLPVSRLLPRILPAVLILAVFFTALTITKNYLVRYWFQPGFEETIGEAFNTQWLAVFIGGLRLMSIWLLAYYAYHYSQRELRAVKQAAKAKEAAFQNLSAQINPHFFFNSLNSIKALVVEDPKAARQAIDKLSDLMRNSLYSSRENLVTLQQELNLVEDYLALEKIRFEEKLQIEWNINQSLLNQPVLRLSIQSLVENAIKHGISQLPGGGFIHINVSRTDDHMLVSVENTGTLTNDLHKGIGLSNLEDRLILQFNGKASFQLIQENDQSVIAIFKTPLS